MECSEFDVILQDRLDRRLPLPLGDEARAHLRQCSACEQDYQFFQQLARLTQNPASDTRRGSMTLAESLAESLAEPVADRNLDQVIGRCVAALGPEIETRESAAELADETRWEQWPAEPVGLGGPGQTSDDGIPLASWVSLPGQNGLGKRSSSRPDSAASGSAGPASLADTGLGATYAGRTARSNTARSNTARSNTARSNTGRSNTGRSADRLAALAAAVSAALLLLAVAWIAWRLTPAPPQLSRQSTESNAAATEAAGSPTGDPGLAGTPLASDDLREIARNWDDSVVAFDRGWRQMAVGRVRAHQIPGMQPAVYPITGAVEAFRKNWIRRNPDGLAAGLQW